MPVCHNGRFPRRPAWYPLYGSWQALLRFRIRTIVLPISVQSLVSSFVGASDALMLGTVLSAVGALGFTVMWVLSTMIKTWDDSVVYSVDDGTVVHTLGCDYSLGGFIEFYRLEAVCVVLGVLLAAGISLLL